MRTRIVIAVVAAACLGLGTGAAAATVERSGRLPKLTQPDAERYAKQSIKSKFEYFDYAFGKVIRCNRRVSRVRLNCKVKWGIGDVSVKGKVTVWYRWKRGDVWWYSRGKVKQLDTYCALDKPKSHCTDTKTWGR